MQLIEVAKMCFLLQDSAFAAAQKNHISVKAKEKSVDSVYVNGLMVLLGEVDLLDLDFGGPASAPVDPVDSLLSAPAPPSQQSAPTDLGLDLMSLDIGSSASSMFWPTPHNDFYKN